MVLDIIGQPFAPVEPFLQFGMGDIAGDDQRAGQAQPRLYRVMREGAANLVHRLAKIHRDYLAPEGGSVNFGEKTRRVNFQLLEEYALGGDLAEDLPVRRARDA